MKQTRKKLNHFENRTTMLLSLCTWRCLSAQVQSTKFIFSLSFLFIYFLLAFTAFSSCFLYSIAFNDGARLHWMDEFNFHRLLFNSLLFMSFFSVLFSLHWNHLSHMSCALSARVQRVPKHFSFKCTLKTRKMWFIQRHTKKNVK